MNLTTLIVLALLFSCEMYSQDIVMVLKKKHRSVQLFWKDSYITFQQQDKEWIRGIIKRITADSFYLTKEIIRYGLIRNDTIHFSGFAFALSDVHALPTKKEHTVYRNDQVYVTLGHESFVWLKRGDIFQIAGASYVTLNIINDLAHNSPPFAKQNLPNLAIGAALFLFGKLLQHTYYPHLRIGKNYRLTCIVFRNETPTLKSF